MIPKLRAAAAIAAALVLAACSSGGGGDSGGTKGSGGSSPTPPPTSKDQVTVDGVVTFDFVPVVAGSPGGLDYDATEQRPARAVTVEAVAAGEVLDSTTTDTAGAYSLSLPVNRTLFLRVRAEMIRTEPPTWDVRVVDNTDGDAAYVLDGTPFDTGAADSTHDLNAPSGWTGSSYGADRSAAPFAMLDTIYEAMQRVLEADPNVLFPALLVHWSPDNVPSSGDISAGEIRSSFYSSSSGIYVLGAENSDTDEYDRHVIAHEWGHYFEDHYSRSDSIGGAHTKNDVLDMRTAFGEGFGNAFSGIATGSSVYIDASGPRQSRGFNFDLEGSSNGAPGWFSEQSVDELLWDLYDAAPDPADNDTLALGFGPIYSVMRGAEAATPALTSIFSFLDGLKAARPGDVAAIDLLTQAQAIEPVADEYGAGETNDAGTDVHNILPIYREDLIVNGGPVHDVCSTNEFESTQTGAEGKLGPRVFFKLTVETTGTHTFTMTRTSKPAGTYADPDIKVHKNGPLGELSADTIQGCKDDDLTPDECVEVETGQMFLPETGQYVVEVYEWQNTGEGEDFDPPILPIGKTCFDVEVTRP